MAIHGMLKIKCIIRSQSLICLWINVLVKSWFATGTPTFLMKLIKKTELDTTEFENKKVSEILFDSYNLENLNIFALLFQTGYLTITEINQKSRTIQYVLNYPNF